ncbi:hypothetical protein CPB85DRAFT_1432939 [Mucidula mucida]|nr:hypothetical protein CPB85DRAFT_1432939 [Mucidula mucida]
MDSTIARPVIMEKDNPAIFDWDQSVMLLSAITQSLLFGMILVEASQYWLGYDRDSLRKKAYVALTAIENAKAWWVLVLGEVVTDIPVYTFSLALNGVVIALCEAFFVRDRRSPWVLYPLSFGLIIITTAIIYYSINVHIGMDAIKRAAAMGNKISPWAHSGALRNGYNIAINVFIWGTLVIDSFVAIITTYHLSKQKIGLPASDSIVQTLMYFVWQTAVLPQLCMITAGGLFHAETHNKRYSLIVLFVTLAGKIYVYMVIWTLNHRDALRKRFTSLGEDTLDRFRWERGCTPSVEDIPNSVKLAANDGNSESLPSMRP